MPTNNQHFRCDRRYAFQGGHFRFGNHGRRLGVYHDLPAISV